MQIYTNIVVVHFRFYYFFAFFNDEERELMLVLLFSQYFHMLNSYLKFVCNQHSFMNDISII